MAGAALLAACGGQAAPSSPAAVSPAAAAAKPSEASPAGPAEAAAKPSAAAPASSPDAAAKPSAGASTVAAAKPSGGGAASASAAAEKPSGGASAATKPSGSAAAAAKPSASGEAQIKVTLSGGDPNGFPVRISQSGGGSVSMLPVYAAIQTDFFKDQRINASVVNISGGLAPLAALTRGDIEYSNTPSETIQGAISGLPLKVVFSIWQKSPWMVIGKTQYNSLADLKGKLVATAAAGTANNLTLIAALKKGGLTNDVTVVPTPSTVDIYNQLLAGTVDAGVVSPPFDAMAEQKGFHEVAFIGDALDLPYSGLGTSTTFIRDHRPQVVATIRALLDTEDWLKAHPDQASDVFAKAIGSPPDIARKGVDKMLPLIADNGEMPVAQVQQTIDLQAQTSGKPVSLKVEDAVDYGPLHDALAAKKS